MVLKLFFCQLQILKIICLEYLLRILKEYIYWINTIKKDRNKLLKSRIVPLKSKVRIIAILYFPELWGKLAKLKRVVIFKKSV